METPKPPSSETSDIPQKIFSQFIAELKKSDISIEIIEQLEKTIVNEGNFSESALRIALTKNTNI